MSSLRLSLRLIRLLFLFALLSATACGGRAPATAKTAAANVERPTAQIVAGFQALPQTVMPTETPTSTPAVITLNVPVTSTVMVASTAVVVTRIVTVTTTPVPTPTLLPTWTPTAPFAIGLFTPVVSADLPLGDNCDNSASQITSPRMGEKVIWGTTLPITGTSNPPNFLYWKIQYMPDSSYSDPVKRDSPQYGWGELYRSEKDPRHLQTGQPRPIVNGLLASWDTKTVQPGIYWIRLVSNQIDGNFPEPCVVKLLIARY